MIHGRQLAQNVIDQGFQARTDAFDFLSGGQYLELIHTNSVGEVGSLPFSLLCGFASVFPCVPHAWLLCVFEAAGVWAASLTSIRNLYKGSEAYAASGGLF